MCNSVWLFEMWKTVGRQIHIKLYIKLQTAAMLLFQFFLKIFIECYVSIVYIWVNTSNTSNSSNMWVFKSVSTFYQSFFIVVFWN